LSFAATDARMPDRRAPINIEIRSGDRLALIGTSGSGKTTAIEALLGAKDGILSNAAVSGLASRSVRLELPSVGVRYLTETPVFENGTVLFNCQAELSECKTIIWSLALFRGMDELAIEGFLQRSILQSGEPMSLGERQRVQLIRAIAAKPRALFLDEALSGLEEDLEREIIQALIGNRSIEILVYIGHRRSIQDLFSKRLTY
jgi:ABC-type bacteriocin/lantibiotic exporter with double-glycine peptidase domain